MKPRSTMLAGLVLLAGLARPAPGALTFAPLDGHVTAESGSPTVWLSLDLPIPDGSVNGVSDTRTVTSSETDIRSLSVWLAISGTGADGGFNGDLYVTLIHESGYAVLLNRPGRSSADEFGYGDSGMNVMFADAAPNGDVHGYGALWPGSLLTGLWAPDGRAVDPDVVDFSSPRSALLSSFNGLNPNGAWTLFVADLASGGQQQVVSWGLAINSVPEGPAGPWCASILLALLGHFELCRWRRTVSRRGGGSA